MWMLKVIKLMIMLSFSVQVVGKWSFENKLIKYENSTKPLANLM